MSSSTFEGTRRIRQAGGLLDSLATSLGLSSHTQPLASNLQGVDPSPNATSSLWSLVCGVSQPNPIPKVRFRARSSRGSQPGKTSRAQPDAFPARLGVDILESIPQEFDVESSHAEGETEPPESDELEKSVDEENPFFLYDGRTQVRIFV
ncbi:hypothetical protein Dimus_020121 [Dionaea muscipula]